MPEEKPWRDWYTTTRWLARRRDQLAREPLCSRHLDEGRYVPATVAHHVVRHNGNYDLFWNGKLRSLCKQCHDSYEQQAEVLGYDTAIGEDGFPIDPNHPFYQVGGGGWGG